MIKKVLSRLDTVPACDGQTGRDRQIP